MSNLDAIDHHIDIVLLGFFELRQIVVLKNFAANAKPYKTLGLQLVEGFAVFAFAVARNRREQHEFGVFGQRHHGVDHLRHALRLQGLAVIRAIGRASAGKQQTQVIVDLSHRAYGGARVVAGGFLFDADRGRQAFDQIDIGLVEPAQELARVGGQAFYVATLAFGIQGVKRQTRLTRTRQTGDHDQLVAWNIEVDVLQVVRAGTTNADVAHRGGVVEGLA